MENEQVTRTGNPAQDLIINSPYWTETDSSAISGFRHTPKTRTLWVKYRSAPELYAFEGVSPYEARRLRSAESVGSYLAKNIKPRHRCSAPFEVEPRDATAKQARAYLEAREEV